MRYKKEPITSTVTIHYQYRIHPDRGIVTKSSTASVQSYYLKAYHVRHYRPIWLFSRIPFYYRNMQNITDYTQEIIPVRTFRCCYFGLIPVLVSIFSVHTSITYYNTNTHSYVTSHWERYYRIGWRIPPCFWHCDLDYTILRQSLRPINAHTARNTTLLSVRILSFSWQSPR